MTVTCPTVQAGLDSLGAIDLQNAISSKLGVALPATLIFDFPTIRALVDALGELISPAEAQQPSGDLYWSDEDADLPVSVASEIVAASCLYPKAAGTYC